jgi:hypothetical protein
MQHIYNRKRFDQKADFSSMLLSGTDIDFFAEVKRKLYLMVEWKCVGAGLPFGQMSAFRTHVHDLGQVKPAFHVVAFHDTRPEESMGGENSYVAQVFYRLPNMTSAKEYTYDAEEVPTLNQWLADFSYEWRLQHILKEVRPLPLWEGIPQVKEEPWDGETQWPAPSAFFDHIRPIRQSYECV